MRDIKSIPMGKDDYINILCLTALFLLILTFAFGNPVKAYNISIADSTLIGNHSVLIINGTSGEIIAQGYSTQSYDIGESDPVIIHIKPEAINQIEDPGTALDSLLGIIQKNGIALFVLVILGGLIIWRK